MIHRRDKDGAQLYVGDAFGNVAADAAVDVLHLAGIAAAGNIGGGGVTLDIHKYCAKDYDIHMGLAWNGTP